MIVHRLNFIKKKKTMTLINAILSDGFNEQFIIFQTPQKKHKWKKYFILLNPKNIYGWPLTHNKIQISPLKNYKTAFRVTYDR
jgi:hypothetical protein